MGVVWLGVLGVCGVLLSELVRRRRYQARLEAGQDDLEAPVKLRLVQPTSSKRWARRWREGFLRRNGEELTFRPRPPRPGPHIDLSGSTMTGTRPARPAERMWAAGGTVLLIDGPGGQYEIATGGGVADKLARTLLGAVEGENPDSPPSSPPD